MTILAMRNSVVLDPHQEGRGLRLRPVPAIQKKHEHPHNGLRLKPTPTPVQKKLVIHFLDAQLKLRREMEQVQIAQAQQTGNMQQAAVQHNGYLGNTNFTSTIANAKRYNSPVPVGQPGQDLKEQLEQEARNVSRMKPALNPLGYRR